MSPFKLQSEDGEAIWTCAFALDPPAEPDGKEDIEDGE